MKHRKLIEFFLIPFELFLLPWVGMSQQTQDLKIMVSIFQIPPFQTVIFNEPTQKEKEGEVGGIRGEMTSGNVTCYFPDGIVSFETNNFSDKKEIYRIIKEKVRFTDITGILPIEDIYFLVNSKNYEASVIKEEMYPSKHKHLMKELSLHFTPLMIEEDELIVNVKFSAQTAEESPDQKKLLDYTIGAKFSKTLLVGFPTNEEGGRGTVYWLAFSVKD